MEIPHSEPDFSPCKLPTAVHVLVVVFTKVIYWSVANTNMQGSFSLHRADVTTDIYFQVVSDLERNGHMALKHMV